jgi:hypothetical protein
MSALPEATPADVAKTQADRPPRVYAEQNKAMLPLVPKPTELKVPDRPGNQPSVSAPSLFFQNNAAGMDNNVFGGSPPDPGGIAGENHFVQTVNSSWMGIYRKSDLAQLRTTNLQTFFGSGRGVFDPHMTLDYATRRYAVVATDGTDIHLGVSRTTDPMGGWCTYRLGGLNADNPGGLADYPLFAFNSALYISVTEYNRDRQFTGNRMIIIGRQGLLNCGGIGVGFYANLTFPGTNDRVGAIAPVSSSFGRDFLPGLDRWVASHAGGGQDITLFEYHTDTGLRSYRMPSQAYAAPPDAAQRDSGNRIDTGDSRIFHATEALIKDGFGESHITFALTSACTFGGDPTVSACLEWFRIRTFCVGNPSCDEVIEEQGIFGFGTNTFTFFPSVAMDVARNIVYNFSFSGTNFHPSAGSLARGYNSYSGSYFQDFGTHVYNVGNPARWGDYSSIFLDPVGQNPGRTFWSSTQTTIANDRWGTNISGIQSLGS